LGSIESKTINFLNHHLNNHRHNTHQCNSNNQDNYPVAVEDIFSFYDAGIWYMFLLADAQTPKPLNHSITKYNPCNQK